MMRNKGDGVILDIDLLKSILGLYENTTIG